MACRRLACGFLLPLAAVFVAFALFASPASGHIRRSDGSWVYRYYTHDSGNPQCGLEGGAIDPLNIIYYQYGEALRINDHSNAETDWYGDSNRQDQVMCVNPSGTGWSTSQGAAEEQGHGCLPCPTRAHLRIFPAGHLHLDLWDKWSTADVHHEALGCCPSHYIDEDWELWENHYASEMAPAHNIYPDTYDRLAAGYWRGYFDNGDVTRVGGLHNGTY